MFHTILAYASNLLILLFIAGIPLYASVRKVDVFSEFVDGAKDGWKYRGNF